MAVAGEGSHEVHRPGALDVVAVQVDRFDRAVSRDVPEVERWAHHRQQYIDQHDVVGAMTQSTR